MAKRAERTWRSPSSLFAALLSLAACAEPKVEAATGDAASGLEEEGATLAEEVAVLGELWAEPWAETPQLLRVSEPFTGDLGEIRRRRVLRVLVSYNRTNFFLSEGRLRGFEYELFQELEKHARGERARGEPGLDVAFLPLPQEELLPALLAGHGDVAAASLHVTPERAARVAFCRPYLEGVEQILVAHRAAPPVASWENLAGEEIHVLPGSSALASLERMSAELVARGLAPLAIRLAGRGLTTDDLFELVSSGVYAYTLADDYLAEVWASALDGLRLEPELVASRGGRIAWAVRPDNPELAAWLDAFVEENGKGTLIGNVLFRRYFEQARWVEQPLFDPERNRLTPFLAPLQEHSEAFGFDWRLIAAQVYQESRLDPRATNSKGAIGLLQVRPGTGKDMGVTDLLDPERNLYAGIRYLAWLRSHYFDEPGLDRAVRIDFALAAYNAGASRVRRWRRAAPERGLDPDRWFGNVELLALEDVGREPVQYVAGINKNFLVFERLLDDLALRDAQRRSAEAAAGR